MLVLTPDLKCANCGSTLTSELDGTTLKVTPCSCRGDCPLCGGSGIDISVNGPGNKVGTRPCPCRSDKG